jgi:hypothetical protein
MNRIATLNGWCGSAIVLALFDQVQYTFPDRYLLPR